MEARIAERYHRSAAPRLLCGSVLRRSLSAAKTDQERQHPVQAEASHNGLQPQPPPAGRRSL